jgi:DtxR family transcriptional regulator, Mn-dependent transcriptional regulator
METSLSQEAEEYIESIYKLQKRNGIAKTKDLSEAMGLVPGSITNTIEHLESHGLVNHEPYRGVKLTQEGQRLALDIIRKHRLAERLLTDVLNVDWSEVHEDACKLEHALTKDLTDLLDERLGYPRFCPHGNPIPTENGSVDEQPSIPLSDASPYESYIVDRIIDEGRLTLNLLAKENIKPGVKLLILTQDTEHVILQVDTKECKLNIKLASNVLVKKGRHKSCC